MAFKRALTLPASLPLQIVLSLLLSIMLCGSAFGQALVAVPALAGHVNDHAGMLSETERANLERALTDYEDRTGSQIVILTLDSTAPEAIEQYGIRVADAWKVGRAKVDDGVILLVAKNNPKALRRLRIEAGRGVQGSLTDAQSKRVLEDVIAPYFRQNDYYGGLNAGVAALSTLLDKENLPAAPQAQPQSSGNASNQTDGFWGLLPILLFFVLVVISRLRSRGTGNNLNHNNWGTAAGVVLGSVLSQSGRGGGFGGGGFGGGGGSGGGFSGGGGSFDGGGASGDW
jgi:uncharacterized protein